MKNKKHTVRSTCVLVRIMYQVFQITTLTIPNTYGGKQQPGSKMGIKYYCSFEYSLYSTIDNREENETTYF